MRGSFSVFCVCAAAPILLAPTTTQGASPEKEMHATITVKMRWDKQFERTHETGSASVRVTGKIKLAEEEGEFLQYEPAGLNATYDFEFKRVMTDPHDECFGKTILHETGSGAGTPQFDFQAMLGSSGQMHNLQYQATSGGGLDIGKMLHMGSQDAFDTYTFMLVLPGELKTTEKTLCPRPETRSLPRTLTFQMRCKELTGKNLSGSYQWSSSVDWGSSFPPPMEVFVGSCDGTEFFAPVKGSGEVSYSVNWSFGDPKPIVEIWREEEDITDDEVDVMIGRKVRLEAKALPEGLSISDVKWEIDRDLIVAGYESSLGGAHVVPFDEGAFNRPVLEFFYKKGSFGGLESTVKVSAKVDNKDVEAETTFKVYQPEVGRRSVTPYGAVMVGPHADGKCHLYLGSVPANRDGMEIEHEIVMPWFDEEQHLLQYVQRIKEDMLEYRSESYISQANTEWCLDTNYPANNRPPTPTEARFLDSPGPPVLPGATKELHVHDQFETYLMFKPSANAEDPDAIWVPVEVDRWDWSAGVQCATTDRDPPCSSATCPSIYTNLPDPTPEPWPAHPEWSCNVTSNERKTVGVDYDEAQKKKWDEELNRRRQEGRDGMDR